MATHPESADHVWHCEAYGPELDALEPAGAPWCFFELHGSCASAGECNARLQVERVRLWARLLVGALEGDEVCRMLLEDIGGDATKLLRATEED